MNLDDESLISAYLDDELDPADRLAVAWSVESSPPLADQLRAATLARDAVAGLDRPPAPRDLAPAISARIARSRRQARLAAWTVPARLALAGSLAATAASLLFAIILLHRSTHALAPRPVALQPADPSVQPDDISASPVPDAPVEPAVVVASAAPAASPPSEPPKARVAPVPVDRALEDRRRFAERIERGDLERVTIVTDVIDASERIRDLLQQDARKSPDFARFTIREGLVIDPDQTGPAEVYAVVINKRHRGKLLSLLGKEFPDIRDDPTPNLALLTQLTDLNQVAFFRGTEAADLVEPPGEFLPLTKSASKFRGDKTQFQASAIVEDPAPGELPPIVTGEDAGMPGTVAPSGSPTRPRPQGAAIAAKTPPRTREETPLTMLIWVTRPTHR